MTAVYICISKARFFFLESIGVIAYRVLKYTISGLYTYVTTSGQKMISCVKISWKCKINFFVRGFVFEKIKLENHRIHVHLMKIWFVERHCKRYHVYVTFTRLHEWQDQRICEKQLNIIYFIKRKIAHDKTSEEKSLFFRLIRIHWITSCLVVL